ncbi:MAG: murein biosynthesis integral membrane protein MurJ, partial [Candidatus Omnitrophota bacterium]
MKKLFKSAGVISGFTLLSRILGFVRDIIIAGLFGTNVTAQAFFVAFRIPNTLRQLTGEGAANAAIIPVLTEYIGDKDKRQFWHIVNTLLNLIAVILTIVAIIGTVFAPII